MCSRPGIHLPRPSPPFERASQIDRRRTSEELLKNGSEEKMLARSPANADSGVYHKPGTRWYGKTKQGKYTAEADAIKAGYKASGKRSAQFQRSPN
jgi:hypothetical protein